MNSRFKGIFETAKEAEIKPTEKKSSVAKSRPEKKTATQSPLVSSQPTRKKGSGKSSNPDYAQALAYVKKDTLRKVKENLFYNPTQDFSDLVETLLTDWLKKQK
jgi:hypothetical protein